MREGTVELSGRGCIVHRATARATFRGVQPFARGEKFIIDDSGTRYEAIIERTRLATMDGATSGDFVVIGVSPRGTPLAGFRMILAAA